MIPILSSRYGRMSSGLRFLPRDSMMTLSVGYPIDNTQSWREPVTVRSIERV
jgi:hypothetical protein